MYGPRKGDDFFEWHAVDGLLLNHRVEAWHEMRMLKDRTSFEGSQSACPRMSDFGWDGEKNALAKRIIQTGLHHDDLLVSAIELTECGCSPCLGSTKTPRHPHLLMYFAADRASPRRRRLFE